MSNSIQQYISSKLEQRKTENNFRSLKVADGLIDFYSNDYLGFARDTALQSAIEQEIKNNANQPTGSTGSRLLSGNNAYVEALEAQLAAFHGSESALLFNSGFDANYGLLSTLPYRGDTIIYDELAHASFHDGMRSSKAASIAFKHNDVAHLEEKLKAATGLKYVVVESVYSMDGDIAPLTEISALCKKYSAGLIVDEAHAIGTQGAKGEGLATGEIETLARVYTFGKAMGTHGAVVVCNQQLKEFFNKLLPAVHLFHRPSIAYTRGY
jgi:8-amino-7-oxononanoate synthase